MLAASGAVIELFQVSSMIPSLVSNFETDN